MAQALQRRPPPPVRVKHTTPPPDICTCCWWEIKYKKLLDQHKKLRMELVKGNSSNGKRPGRSAPREPEREWDGGGDDETKDLVDRFANIND